MTDSTVRWNWYGGVAIAVLGFVITRQFVAGTMQTESTLSFLLLSLPPLVFGLGLTVYGVILAVGRFSPAYVRTVTIWCGLGTASVVALVAVTQLETMVLGELGTPFSGPQLLIGNLLLGGAVGGILVGDRSAANSRKRREIKRTANRAALVNRRLRHDVINAATIIGGHADLLRDHPERGSSVNAIETAADRITSTIEEVGQIVSPNEDDDLRRVRLEQILTAAVDEYTGSVDSVVRLGDIPDGLTVMADERLTRVFGELLDNAVEYGGQEISVHVSSTAQAVTVTIEDGGSGLPAKQRALLETGEFPEYDDPSAGFGLQVVSLLVERYGGRITVTGGSKSGEPHRVTVRLPRYDDAGSVTDRVGIRLPTIGRAVTAGLIAGVVMGGFHQTVTGAMPVIGALYGVSHVWIGWLTHLFHSVIFGLLFATGCAVVDTDDYVSTLSRTALLGLGWGTVLWFVAAGFVMPAWLLALGEPATLPNLTPIGLLAHGLWGVTLGGSYVLLGTVDGFERLSTRT